MPIWGTGIISDLFVVLYQILIFVFIFKAPPKPTKKEIPEILGKTTTTVSLQYKKGLFSDENGQVIIIT